MRCFLTFHKLKRGLKATPGRYIAYRRRVVSFQPTQPPIYRAYVSPEQADYSQKSLGPPRQDFGMPAYTNLCLTMRYARIYYKKTPSTPESSATGCSHHQPPDPAVPVIPKDYGPLSPTLVNRRPPLSACIPADRSRRRPRLRMPAWAAASGAGGASGSDLGKPQER